MRENKDVRLFFALWPDDPIRQQMVDLFSGFDLGGSNGHFMRPGNIHMTLHFIGNVSIDEMQCMKHRATELASKAFELTIDSLGYFKKARVLWLGCRQAPQALFELQRQLGEQLSPCGYRPEQRPYNPHVSIARNLLVTPHNIEFEPIAWKLDRFVLVESKAIPAGVEYQVIDEYALH